MRAIADIAPLLAAGSSLLLAAAIIFQRRGGRLQWTLAVALTGFAVESLIAYILVTGTDAPEDRLFWLQALTSARLGLVVPWTLFVAALLGPKATMDPKRWRFIVAGGCAAVPLAVTPMLGLQAFVVSDLAGPFHAARLNTVGRWAVIVELLATVVILGGLEISLRTSQRGSRWRIKYLLLGVGGVFLVRFYFLSQLLLFQVLLASYLTTEAATLVVGNVLIAASLFRDWLFGTELTVSRHVLYRSAVVGVLGVYLFAVGIVGWLLNTLDIAENLFWGSFVIFVALAAVAVILLSEDVRWRVKRLIGRHFYRSKYDYRQHWMTFTKRLASLVTIEELTPQLLGAVIDAVGATKGTFYLLNDRHTEYHQVATVGIGRRLPQLALDSALITHIRSAEGPVGVERPRDSAESKLERALPEAFPEIAVAIPLVWRETLTGVMLIGPERTGQPYTIEDLDFLATMGQQAAGAIASASLSEALAQSREFDAFHRLTSFVIHDLKNSISALSMLSQNALANFDDPEFQRDALRTLSRTVDRMKALLAKLKSAPEAITLRSEPVDLAALVQEASAAAADGRIHVVAELAPLPAVFGDPEALLHVVQNLVKNAVEALTGEGTLTVKTYREGSQAVISIADNGCGMSDDFLHKALFTPFRSTTKGGWGIGLYQAKGIVEAHGGSVDVASRLGEGTTFWVRLPLERPGPMKVAK